MITSDQKIGLFFLFLISFSICQSQTILPKVERVPLDSIHRIQKIAFGSANHQSLPQEMWLNILDQKPNIWVSLGNMISGFSENTDELNEKYNKQLTKENYIRFLRKIPVIGIWDKNELGGEKNDTISIDRKISQQLFLDFIGEHLKSVRREKDGIYTSYIFGEPDKRVRFIMLDTRYFRKKNAASELLGETQWLWLEKTLEDTSAQLTFICSGIPILSDNSKEENWNIYPNEISRFKKILLNKKQMKIILLSGNSGCNEIMSLNSNEQPLKIYEFSSGGLNHVQTKTGKNINSFAVANRNCLINSGLITIQWNKPTSVKIEFRDVQDFVIQEKTIFLEDVH